VCDEAGEIVEAQATPPDFDTKLLEKSLGGDAASLGRGPSGLRDEAGRAGIEGLVGSDKEQGVGEYGESGCGLHGADVTDLRLSDSKKRLFVPETNLDVPALEVGLYDQGRIEGGIGADEKGRPTVVERSLLSGPVGERGDDNQQEGAVGACSAPEHGAKSFEADEVGDAGVGDRLSVPGH